MTHIRLSLSLWLQSRIVGPAVRGLSRAGIPADRLAMRLFATRRDGS